MEMVFNVVLNFLFCSIFSLSGESYSNPDQKSNGFIFKSQREITNRNKHHSNPETSLPIVPNPFLNSSAISYLTNKSNIVSLEKIEEHLENGKRAEQQNNFRKAEQHYLEAAQAAKESFSIEHEIEAYRRLYNVCEITGNYKGALTYYKRLNILENRLHNYSCQYKENAEHVEQMATEQAILIADLEAKHDVQEAEIRNYHIRTIAISVGFFYLLATVSCIYFYKRQKDKVKKGVMSRRLLEYRLKALKAQMRPHFIFNALNSIQYYVLKSDKVVAYNYLGKFAQLMRKILNHSEQELVSLQEEIEAIKLYVELEQLRFDNKFDYVEDSTPDLLPVTWEIPPMLIQPYIENAIIHGLAHKEEKGILKVSLSIKSKHLVCIIEDNGIGRSESAKINSNREKAHQSFGQATTENRLKTLEKKENLSASVDVEDLYDEQNNPSGTRVTLRIPVKYNLLKWSA